MNTKTKLFPTILIKCKNNKNICDLINAKPNHNPTSIFQNNLIPQSNHNVLANNSDKDYYASSSQRWWCDLNCPLTTYNVLELSTHEQDWTHI